MKKPTQPAAESAAAGPSRTNDGTGISQALSAAAPSEATPYLATYSVVEDLVRTFLSEELGRAIALGEKTLTAAQAGEASQAAVKRLARIFTGQDRRFTPLVGWNTPAPTSSRTLTQEIQSRIGHVVEAEHLQEPESAAQALFAIALHEYREAIGAYAQSQDAAALTEKGEELVENYTRLLVGLPADEDESE